MKPCYLAIADLRFALRWIAEAASPGKLAVALAQARPVRRKHAAIFLVDPTDRTRNLLLEVTP